MKSFLIRDLNDGSFAGLLLNSPKTPRVPEGFEATPVNVKADVDGSDTFSVNVDSTEVAVGTSPDGFFLAMDAEVWRDVNGYLDWKADMVRE